MEVMDAFISAEKLSDNEDVGETPIVEDDESHSSHGTVTGKEQNRRKVTGKELERSKITSKKTRSDIEPVKLVKL
jgi:hypothetical protein